MPFMIRLWHLYPVFIPSRNHREKTRGILGKEYTFSLFHVCYKESKDLEEVTISGVVTSKNKAWSFDAKVVESSFVDTLLLVLEVIAELPFN
jgi:hypothetical protein